MNVTQAIHDTKRQLGGDSTARNRMASTAGTATSTLLFEFDLNGIASGAILELPEGEQVFVWSANPSTKQATVERGFNGTTPEELAVGDVVAVNPRYLKSDIRSMLQAELTHLEAEGLYRFASAELAYDDIADAYDTTAITDMISPYMLELTQDERTEPIPFIKRDGYIRPIRMPLVTPATLHYRASFTPFTDDTDDLETDCGLASTAHDLLSLGVAYRLLIGREAVRVNERAKEYSRSDEGLQPGSITALSRQLAALRALRLSQELDRQFRRWPLLGG